MKENIQYNRATMLTMTVQAIWRTTASVILKYFISFMLQVST